MASPRVQRADARRNIAAILDAATECLARDPEMSIAGIPVPGGVGRITLHGHSRTRAEPGDAVLARTAARASAAEILLFHGQVPAPAFAGPRLPDRLAVHPAQRARSPRSFSILRRSRLVGRPAPRSRAATGTASWRGGGGGLLSM